MECVGKGTPFSTERGIPNGMPICNNVKLKHYIIFQLDIGGWFLALKGRFANRPYILCISAPLREIFPKRIPPRA